MGKVVSLPHFKMEKQYQQYGSCVIDLSIDVAFPVQKELKRDIVKELTDSYIRLLTNYINNK